MTIFLAAEASNMFFVTVHANMNNTVQEDTIQLWTKQKKKIKLKLKSNYFLQMSVWTQTFLFFHVELMRVLVHNQIHWGRLMQSYCKHCAFPSERQLLIDIFCSANWNHTLLPHWQLKLSAHFSWGYDQKVAGLPGHCQDKIPQHALHLHQWIMDPLATTCLWALSVLHPLRQSLMFHLFY